MALSRRELAAAALGTLGGVALRPREALAMAGAQTTPGNAGAATALAEPAPTAAPTTSAGWRLQRLSWAGVRIEAPGASVFIDTVADAGIWDGKRPVVPPAADNVRRAALVTHLHNDHFDVGALKALLGDHGRLFCPRAAAIDAASRGLRVSAVDDYQPVPFDELVLQPVPAVDGFGDVQVSWIVRFGERRLIHCGDTQWHGRFDLIGRAYGPFDIAFLPINGVRVRRGKALGTVPATLLPEEAVAAAVALRTRLMVPIHYGAGDEDYVEQPDALTRLAATAHREGVAIQVVPEGAWVSQPAV